MFFWLDVNLLLKNSIVGSHLKTEMYDRIFVIMCVYIDLHKQDFSWNYVDCTSEQKMGNLLMES